MILLIVPVVAAALALGFTTFVKPRYQSSAIVFPTSGNSIDHTIDNPNFGYDIEADRLLQILQSTELIDSIAKRFHLASYYQLDTQQIDWKEALQENVRRDLTFERTRYMSIVISAKTKHPEMSADMVNDVLIVVEKIREKIYKKNLAPAVQTLKAEYDRQSRMSDSLLVLINSKINFSKEFLLKQDSEGQFTIISDPSVGLVAAQLLNQYFYAQKLTNESYGKYEKAVALLDRPLPSVYVVSRATPSYKKISPSYIKNAAIAFGVALLACIFLLYVKEETGRHRISEAA